MTNIKKGLELVGRPAEIPDCSRDDLPEFFKEMGYTTGVELGVYKGEYTEKFLQAGLKIYGIDPWGCHVSSRTNSRYKARQEELYNITKDRLAPYLESGQCELIRKTSMDALKLFKNGTIDFIYIDADHRFKYIAEDLYEWSWKVRKDGVVSGHDYFKTSIGATTSPCHVGPIVESYTKCFLHRSWYLIGKRFPNGNEKRDKWLSWMWIKESDGAA